MIPGLLIISLFILIGKAPLNLGGDAIFPHFAFCIFLMILCIKAEDHMYRDVITFFTNRCFMGEACPKFETDPN